jgi:hypothetical protein
MSAKEMISKYVCVFCNLAIASDSLNPCALNVICRVDSPRNEQKEQTFYCHVDCLKSHAADDPSIQGSFYITEPHFPTVGESLFESGT